MHIGILVVLAEAVAVVDPPKSVTVVYVVPNPTATFSIAPKPYYTVLLSLFEGAAAEGEGINNNFLHISSRVTCTSLFAQL